jgi:hypothetical protein
MLTMMMGAMMVVTVIAGAVHFFRNMRAKQRRTGMTKARR